MKRVLRLWRPSTRETNQLTPITYTKTAARRNSYPYVPAMEPIKSEGTWTPIGFPAAALIQRITQRPPATCAVLARIAGFHELEAR